MYPPFHAGRASEQSGASLLCRNESASPRLNPGSVQSYFSMPHWRKPGLISADGSWAKVTVHAGIAIGVTIVVGVGVYLVLRFILA